MIPVCQRWILNRTILLNGFGLFLRVGLLSTASVATAIDYHLIGGRDNGSTTPYAALVDSNGIATAITGLPPPAS